MEIKCFSKPEHNLFKDYYFTVYTQYACSFPKISGKRRQLYDACDTTLLLLYAKGAGTETNIVQLSN